MWGAFHRHSVISFPLLVLLLVVVHQIDIYHITVFEAENDTPVTADGDAPVPFQIAFQRVQAISGESNVRRAYRRIEVGQHISNACELIRPNLAGVTVQPPGLRIHPDCFHSHRPRKMRASIPKPPPVKCPTTSPTL